MASNTTETYRGIQSISKNTLRSPSRARKIFLIPILSIVSTSLFAGTVSITTLHSTGQAGSQAADPNFTIISIPGSNSVSSAYVTDSSNFPFGPWYADTPSSSWISPKPSYVGNAADAAGTYVYQTTFDLTGLNSGSASITLAVATDNSISEFVLNGNATPFSYSSFYALSNPVTITTGFVSGVNILDFVTFNGEGPTGLRVEASGTANTLSNVPEPCTFIPGSMVLIGIGLYRRRTS